MNNKKCSKCLLEKAISEFYLDKRFNIPRSKCKSCCSNYNAEQFKNLPTEKKQNMNIKRKAIRKNPLIKAKEKSYNQQYYSNPINASKKRLRMREYFSNPKNIQRRKELNKIKRQNPIYKLHANISIHINHCLKSTITPKNKRKWENLVGYSLNDLKKHLESLFINGMSWDNYGQWHIDHKIPKSSFNITSDSCDAFKQCWSLSNLQPLWATDNLKKSYKIL